MYIQRVYIDITAAGEAAEVEKTEAELDLSTLLANIFDAADEENEFELRWENKPV